MTLKEIKERMSAINVRMAEIQAEIDKPEADIEALDKETDALVSERNELTKQSVQLRATNRDFKPVMEEEVAEVEERSTSSLAYRKAFMNYVMRGEMSEILKRQDESTTKTDVQTVIVPATVTDKLFESNEMAGSIFARVTKTGFAPGMSVKTSTMKPVLAWVAENGKSDRQEFTTGAITFNGYKGEIRIAISLEASVMSLAAFEAKFQTAILEACSLGFDKAIVIGDGSGKPKGVLTSGTYSGDGCNAYTLNNRTVSDYQAWVQLFAKIPQSKKRKAALHINASDWYAYIFGMKDNNGRVIALDTVGFGGDMKPTFMGIPVVLLEDQGLNAFDDITGNATKAKTTAFAYFFDDSDYFFNSNMQLKIKQYTDEDSDEIIHKATIVADGKIVSDKSLVIVCRGVDASSN